MVQLYKGPNLHTVTKAETALAFPSPSLRTRINASSLPVLFTSKIRDREEGIVIYSFYTWFSFLTWVWVNIFLEIVSSKTATTHIFQSGVRNWPASVSRREIEVFNLQAWDSRLRRGSWQVYYMTFLYTVSASYSAYCICTSWNVFHIIGISMSVNRWTRFISSTYISDSLIFLSLVLLRKISSMNYFRCSSD